MYFFSPARQSGQIKENYFFQKQKFEIGFVDLWICGKLLIIPF